jgi:murein DD-endopeptidase MepM/ murein hydrolase activator NlpD
MVALTGCLQQRAAPIDDWGGRFFGRDAHYDMRGNELPRYSNDNPADMPAEQDAKYIHDNRQTYGVSAEVGSVSASDLPPVSASDLPPIEATAAPAAAPPSSTTTTATDDAALVAQQAADKAAAEAHLTSDMKNGDAKNSPAPAQELAPTQMASIDPAATSGATASGMHEQAVDKAALPPRFVWPLKGNIVKDFQANNKEGITIAGREGEPIRASGDGVVVYVGDKLQGYGTMVILQHTKGYVTTYAHLSDAVVTKDDNVIAGQLIGFVGKSGNVTSPQLHFSMREGTKPMNPSGLLK